jgi:hypothetical protein
VPLVLMSATAGSASRAVIQSTSARIIESSRTRRSR